MAVVRDDCGRFFVVTAFLTFTLSLVALPHAAVPQAADDLRVAPTTRTFDGVRSSSQYIEMRDGVKLAADVHLPNGLRAGERTATILHMSRYYRSISIKSLWRAFAGRGFYTISEREMRERMVKAGYSWVDVDVRGTGASFGRWRPIVDEIPDGKEVIDWIIRQPWSAGVVGVAGSSYDGSIAVAQLAHDHPSLKAVIVNAGAWDFYEDVYLPGGLLEEAFLSGYSRLLSAFDRGALGDLGWQVPLMVSGVRPVQSRVPDDVRLQRARTVVLQDWISPVQYRDDVSTVPELAGTFNTFSPHSHVGRRSRVPVLTVTGWYDMALARGQLRQFLTTRAPGSRIRIGPWFHSILRYNASPYARGRDDWQARLVDEMQRFFDRHLRGIDNEIDREPPVHYYTAGAERWATSTTWPPPDVEWQRYFFSEGQHLATAQPNSGEASNAYQVDLHEASGGARWKLVVGKSRDRKFTDRRKTSSRLLTYTSAPLATPLEVTGHPRVTVFLSSTAPDGALFAYLEDVAPDGTVRYVTEGQLRLLYSSVPSDGFPDGIEPIRHFVRSEAAPVAIAEVRSLVIDLLPISHRFPAGHSIRLAISGADAGSFTSYGADGTTYSIHRDTAHASRIDLPTYPIMRERTTTHATNTPQ